MQPRHVTGKRYWLALPRAREVIQEKYRWAYVRDAARALIATTTPGGRYLIVRNGFIPFHTAARVMFQELSPFAFDATELRAIFEYLGRYSQRYEAHLQPGLELLYQRERLKLSSDVPTVDEVDPREAEIQIEHVHDGALKRRTVKGGERIVH